VDPREDPLLLRLNILEQLLHVDAHQLELATFKIFTARPNATYLSSKDNDVRSLVGLHPA